MNLYDATVPIFTKMLGNLDRWIEKASAHAADKKFDPSILASARLTPTQWPFTRQVGAACDQAKFACAKMTGKTPPSHEDNEKTLEETRARVRSVLGYIETFSREDFVGCEERPCSHGWMEGKHVPGGDYLDHVALPNFYFHLVHAYAILRHHGVELGKDDFIEPIPYRG